MCRRAWGNAIAGTLCGLLAGCGVKHEHSIKASEEVETGAGQTRAWKDSFELEKRTLLSVGKNTYFILEPGYQLVLAKHGGGSTEQVVITVLDETEDVDGVETRVVEEREFLNGKLKEISRNFFTICREHKDVFYHGEDVDDYRTGAEYVPSFLKVLGHGGAWRAGVQGARPGLMMPGEIELGARYYQEVAPEIAMDRAEIVRNDMTVEAPAGTFENCLKVIETTPLDPRSESLKVYAPGIGMVIDDDLILVRYEHNQSPPAAPVEARADTTEAPAEVKATAGKTPAPVAATGTFSEVEIPAGEMPATVAAVIAELYPEGRLHEVKREAHPDGRVVYAACSLPATTHVTRPGPSGQS